VEVFAKDAVIITPGAPDIAGVDADEAADVSGQYPISVHDSA
jgi:hypothetical protein